MKYQLKREQQLNCSIGTAWTFFCSPLNLSQLTPKNMRFTVLDDFQSTAIYEGMLINYLVSPILQIPLKWQTKITQVEYQKSFTDFQQKGPYKLWKHYHEFIVNDQGVLMKDTVDYQLPLGVFGTLAQYLFVRKKLQNIFEYRRKVLEQLFNQKNN